MTKVTVAVATYNRAHLLDELFTNLWEQTFDDFDIVVVDDGSTDKTAAVLSQYADEPRVQVHSHVKNRGVGAAKDTAVSLATGEYIAFIDDDDRWEPSKLEKQVSLFDSLPNEYAVVYCGMKHFKDGEAVYTKPVTQVGDIFPEILAENEIGYSSTMARRKYIEEVGGFDPELPRAVDWDLWIRLAEKYKFEAVDETLTHRHIQEDSITEDPNHQLEAREMIREKYSDRYQQHPQAAAELSVAIAELRALKALYDGSRVEALRQRWRVISLDGISLKNLGMLGLSIVGPRGYEFVKGIFDQLRNY